MWTRGSILVGLLASCGGAGPRTQAGQAAQPGQAAAPVAPAEPPPVAAFRAYAARRLHLAPGLLDNQSGSIQDDHSRGAAIAIVMGPNSWSRVRGWVTADCTIITPTQNLGVLLAEAGLWRHPPDLAMLARTLATDLVWSYGDYASLETSGDGGTPALTIAPDGSGRLVFFSSTGTADPEPPPEPPMGGGSGPALQTYRDTVSFTADHKATLRREDRRSHTP